MSVEDVTEILAIDLLGVIPDDESVVVATNQGEPVVGEDSLAGKCYQNICIIILKVERMNVGRIAFSFNRPYKILELTNIK